MQDHDTNDGFSFCSFAFESDESMLLLLDIKSEGPVVSDKQHAKINKPVVPGILRDSAQPQGTHKKKRAVGHQSWADGVKARYLIHI